MLMCRSEGSLSQEIRKKIALFASLPPEAIVSACDVDNIYKVPLTFREQGVDDCILEHFGVEAPEPDLSSWKEPIERAERAGGDERRGPARSDGQGSRASQAGRGMTSGPAGVWRAGQSTRCGSRSSASTCSSRTPTCRSPRRCATPPRCRTRACEIEWVDSELLEGAGAGGRHDREDRERARELLSAVDGILIPGGFGGAGIEGKIAAARIAREQRDPLPGDLPRDAGRRRRVRAPRRRHGGRQLDRVRPRDAVPGDRPAARAEGDRRPRRHDAPRGRPDQAARGLPRAGDLRRGGRLRAPPPPLRGQQPAAPPAAERRSRHLRHLTRRAPRRDDRAARRGGWASILPRLAVPPRVQVPPRAPRAAVPRVRRRRRAATRASAR